MKRSFAKIALLCAALLVGGLFLMGSGQPETTPYVILCSDVSQELSVLSMDALGDETICVAQQENSALMLRINEHGVMARENTEESIEWAALRGGSLFLLSGQTLNAYDAKTLQPTAQTDIPWDADDLLYFSCEEDGTLYAVLSHSRDTLSVITPDGETHTVAAEGEITAFCACDGGVYLWANHTLVVQQKDVTVQSAWQSPPFAALNTTTFLDSEGMLCKRIDTEILPVERCEESLYRSTDCCMAGDALLAVGGKSVVKYNGDSSEHCRLPAVPLAISANGALCFVDDALCYAPFTFVTVTPSPSPTPEPSPTAAPFHVEREFLLCEPGTTMQELREHMKPETVQIRDKLGVVVTNGQLSTGMTANQWTVVVYGDFDGSGTVTDYDLRLAAKKFLQQTEDYDPYIRAIDQNENGKLDTADLLNLSKQIQAIKKEKEASNQ